MVVLGAHRLRLKPRKDGLQVALPPAPAAGHELRPLVSAAVGCTATVAAAAHEGSAWRGSAPDGITVCVRVPPECPAPGYAHSWGSQPDSRQTELHVSVREL